MASSSSIEIKAPWRCLHSSLSTVPAQKEVSFSWSVDQKKWISSDWEEVSRSLAENKAWDHGSCFKDFYLAVLEQVDQLNLPSDQHEPMILEVEQRLLRYIQESSRSNAIMALEPGEPVNGAVNQSDYERAAARLTGSCGKNMDSYLAPLLLDKKFIESYLPQVANDLAKNKSANAEYQANCRKKILKRYTELLIESGYSKSQCKAFPDECVERNGRIQKVLKRIESISDFKSALHQTVQTLGQCEGNVEKSQLELQRLLTQLKIAENCILLKKGESRSIMGDQGTGVAGSYQLKRDDDVGGKPSFTVEVRPSFFVAADLESDPDFESHYREKAQRCFDGISDKLLGPNGEKLKVRFEAPTRVSGKSLPKTNIEIAQKEVRDHSRKWSPQSSCATVIHETFHVLGLVDEYPESSIGVVVTRSGEIKKVDEGATLPAFDCRVRGPEDSIMRNHERALQSVLPGKRVTSCSCATGTLGGMGTGIGTGIGIGVGIGLPGPVGEATKETEAEMRKKFEEFLAEQSRPCRLQLESISPDAVQCPAGLLTVVRDVSYQEWESDQSSRDFIKAADAKKMDSISFSRAIRVEKKPVKGSLLYPAHFRAITQPGCVSANSTYLACASESKKTSRAALGEDRCSTVLPEVCQKGGAEWLQ